METTYIAPERFDIESVNSKSLTSHMTQSNKGKLLLNPLLPLTKLKYRPKKVLKNVFAKENSFDSIEVNNALLHESTERVLPSSIEFKNPRIFSLTNGTIITDNNISDCFITKDGALIDEIAFSYKNGVEVPTRKNKIFKRYFLTPDAIKLNETVFSLLSGGGGSTNYYHWLFDTLPRLKMLNETSYKNEIGKYIIANLSPKYKLETLSYLNIGANKIIDTTDTPHIKANEIIVTTHPNLPTLECIPEWIPQFLRTTFLPAKKSKVKRRIMVSRKNASIRRITNEDLMFAALEKHDFERVFLENLSFKEQVKAFSEAEIIVACHGAGLANLAFSEPNCKIIEIFPPKAESNIYSNLSKIQQLDYTKYSGVIDTDIPGKVTLHSDFKISVNKIMELLGLH